MDKQISEKLPSPEFFTRHDLCSRWQCSTDTLKRREKARQLKAVHLGPHCVRYSLADVLEYEREARV